MLLYGVIGFAGRLPQNHAKESLGADLQTEDALQGIVALLLGPVAPVARRAGALYDAVQLSVLKNGHPIWESLLAWAMLVIVGAANA